MVCLLVESHCERVLASLWWYHGSRYGGQAALEQVSKKGNLTPQKLKRHKHIKTHRPTKTIIESNCHNL